MNANLDGFISKHSTHLFLITLINKLTLAIENGECVTGVFLEFSNAFDTVDHKIRLTNYMRMEFVRVLTIGLTVMWMTIFLHTVEAKDTMKSVKRFYHIVTHWGRDDTATISQIFKAIYLNGNWIGIFWLNFH